MKKIKLYNIFYKNYLKIPNNIFIQLGNKKYTYKKVKDIIDKLQSITKSSKYLTLISQNSILHIAFYLLASKEKKIFVPLDINLEFETLLKQIKKFKLDNIFCGTLLFEKLNKKKFKVFNINKLSRKFNKVFFNQKKSNLENNFLLSFTSGSTSDPKPIVFSEETKILRAKSNIDLYSLKENDTIIISTPLHHTLAIRLMTMAIILKSKIIVIDNYSFEKFMKYIKKYKVKFTFFISNQISEILTNLKYIEYIKSLRAIVSSSSTLPNHLKEKLVKVYNGKVFEIYGLSEASIVSNLNIKKDKKYLNSVGKKIKGVQIKIHKPKNSIGEILIKSKFIFSGYLKKHGTVLKLTKEGYFKTGDIGQLRNNYLYLIGRKKNIIKRSGISIFIEDIEKKLIKSGLFKECYIIPIFEKQKIDPKLCLLYISEKKNYRKIKMYCINNLNKYHLPRYYLPLDVVPKNLMGKINRKQLSILAKERINL